MKPLLTISQQSLSIIFTLIALGVAILGLMGYLPTFRVLGSVRENYIPMAPSTAVSFVLLCIVLMVAIVKQRLGPKAILLLVVTSLVTLFGALVVAEHLSGMDHNFEDLIVPNFGTLDGVPIGRMSPATSVTFFLSGIALFLHVLQQKYESCKPFLKHVEGGLGLFVLLISFVFCLAYFYGAPLLYGHGSTIPMALTTAVAFLFLSAAILVSNNGGFPMHLLTEASTPSYLVRFILPLSTMSVVLGGAIVLSSQHISNGLSSFIIACFTALLTLAIGFISVMMSHHMGRKIDSAEIAAKIARSALQQTDVLQDTQTRLRLTLDATTDGTWEWNLKTGEIVFSDTWCKSLGYGTDEVVNDISFWEKLVHPDDRKESHELLTNHLERKTASYICENRLRTRSGQFRSNLTRGRVVERDDDGSPLRMIVADTEITK